MNPQDKMQQMLAELWGQHRQAILERVDLIAKASEALARGSITPAEREEAQSAAHKLAGVLGTFGRTEGTNLARQIENWFADAASLASHSAQIKETLTELQKEIS